MNKCISLFILSAILAVACSSPSKQSYHDESSELQENTVPSTESQEQAKETPELPKGRYDLYTQINDQRAELKKHICYINVYEPSSAKAKHIKTQYYEKEERTKLIESYSVYKDMLYDLLNKSEIEEHTQFYYEEINKLEREWDSFRTMQNQFDEAIEKAMKD